jgi:hypothetical protein
MNKSQLRDLIFEALGEVLAAPTLPTGTEELFAKFPTLYRTVTNLLTDQYGEFLEGIDWVAPRPSTFRVNLKNKAAFYLKWMGDTFQAQIEGKKYFLDKTSDFQQALDRLGELLKHSEPVVEPGEDGIDATSPGAVEADAAFGGDTGVDTGAAPAGVPAVEVPAEESPDFEEPLAEPEA